ncbi:MAG: protein kinase [Planctomycetota bacterium]
MGELLDDRFELWQRLGAGAFGEAWRAREAGSGREVVVKLLHARHAGDERLLERFRREVRALEQLEHPHVVPLVGAGVDPARGPYYAMAWVPGAELRDVLAAAGRLPLARALRLIDQLLSALEHAHARGILHRDLKPENVLIANAGQPDERVYLIDFGLAKHAQGGARTIQSLTQGSVLGTPLYMSPEQCTGQAAEPRSDVYAVGCLLLELLSGAPPFTLAPGASPVTLLAQHVLEEPPRLEERCPDAPAGLGELIARCLAKEPEARPDAAGLRALLAGSPTDALPPTSVALAPGAGADGTGAAAPPAAAPASLRLEEGQVFAGFPLERLLGEGGFGVVFLTRTPAGVPGALKILSDPDADGGALQARARFVREVRLMRALAHPAIPAVLADGEEAGLPYVVLELIEGQDLEDLLAARGRLELPEVLAVLRQVVPALDHAHCYGVVHCDLKPANVRLRRDGKAYLLDLGIAKLREGSALGGRSVLTLDGGVIGTFAYLPPELGRGRRHVTPMADVYSLGVMVYQLLSGALPFPGDDPRELIRLHQTAEPRHLAELAPHLPPGVADAVMACLAKDPGSRYPTAGTFLEALEQTAAGAAGAGGAAPATDSRAPTAGALPPTARWAGTSASVAPLSPTLGATPAPSPSATPLAPTLGAPLAPTLGALPAPSPSATPLAPTLGATPEPSPAATPLAPTIGSAPVAPTSHATPVAPTGPAAPVAPLPLAPTLGATPSPPPSPPASLTPTSHASPPAPTSYAAPVAPTPLAPTISPAPLAPTIGATPPAARPASMAGAPAPGQAPATVEPHVPSAAAASPAAALGLAILSGSRAGDVLPLPPAGALRLGRDPASELAFAPDEPGVSTRHALLHLDGGAALEDTSSTGSWVEGARVPPGERLPLARGCRIRLGPSLLLLYDRLEALQAPEPAWRGWRVDAPGAAFRLTGPLTLGRAPGAGLQVVAADDRSVSGVHCRLTPRSGVVVLEDLGSTNGTFLRGERVVAAALRPDEAFRLGGPDGPRFALQPGSATLVNQALEPAALPADAPLPPSGDALRAKLEVDLGGARGCLFLFAGTRLRFGRDRAAPGKPRANDLVLRAFPRVPGEAAELVRGRTQRVSGHHGTFVVTGDGLALQDDGSTQGTHLDGRALAPRALTPLGRELQVEVPHALALRGLLLPQRGARAFAPGLGIPAGHPLAGLRLERPRDGSHHTYLLVLGDVGLGSGPDDGVSLPAELGVAPGHATLSLREGGFALTARAAGVSVAGLPLPVGAAQALRPGVTLRLGRAELRFTEVDDGDMKPA